MLERASIYGALNYPGWTPSSNRLSRMHQVAEGRASLYISGEIDD
jgi:hypothetical protein